MFARISPALFAVSLVFVLAEMTLPNLTLIAMGSVVGRIPAAVHDGLSSPAGGRLLLALALAAASYGLSMLRGPAQDALAAATSARMQVAMQGRLIAAVSSPAGVAHLEDPTVLDQLSSAQGELTSYQPADAPFTLLGQVGSQLSGVMACVVLAAFQWWVGLLLLISWLAVRRTLRGLIRARVVTFRRATEPLRRSWYLLGLAWRAPASKEVRVFGLADWIVARHRTEWLAGMAPTWHQVRRLTRHVAWLAVVVFAVYAAAAASLGWSAYHHEITLSMFATMLPMLVATMPAGSVSLTDFSLETMLMSVPDLEALTRGLAPPPASDDVPRGPAAGLPRDRVEFERVGFRYPNGDHDVLAGLDLTLHAGTSLAVVGVNGAGKTTLVTLLAGLRAPTTGRITVDGTSLDRIDASGWQRQIAVVFQDFTRYPLTARENVTMALLDEPVDEPAMRRAVERAGAEQVIAGLPRGWDTVLSPSYDGGVDLSGGQWQRLALARALYAVECGARVLVLDEPTSQLDVRAEAAFYDRFLELTAGITSVIISHRFSTVRRADRIAVLDGGQLSELGDHDALLAAGGTYAVMFEAQAAPFRGLGSSPGQHGRGLGSSPGQHGRDTDRSDAARGDA